MKKRVFLVASSAVLALGLASFVVYQNAEPPEGVLVPVESGLAFGASLDTGPMPAASTNYDLSAHQTLSRVILLIRENYVDPARIQPYEMFLSALNYIQKTVPEVLVDTAEAPRRIKVAVGAAEQTFDLGGLDQLWEVTMALRDIFRFLQQHIPDADQRREVEYAAINGMLATLDPHSILLKPESFDEVKLSTKGEFGGLGIVISIRDGQLTIISPIEGTPASRSGLKAKDNIVKIGEESTVNMGLEEAVHRLRGKPGSKVTIWVLRKGWTESRKFILTRAIIKIESVSSELLADGVGYVRVKSFQNNTYDDMRAHLDKLRKKNKAELKGLVLDLRNNPGGLLDQAIQISDRFIDRGPIVITVGEGNRKREVKQARFSGTETAYPIVTLVNGGSASASEIVAGALKNHDRSVVIGQQTFGKGSVQVLYDFKDQSALKLTIAQYLTPGDISIQSVGITPHVEVEPVTVSKESIQLFADRRAPREKDLEKHLDQHGDSQATPSEAPLVRISHFIPQEEVDGTADEEAAETFTMDFEIQLAHDVLAKANGATGAAQVLANGADLFGKAAAAQEELIAGVFNGLGVDWSAGAKAAAARAEVTLKTSADDSVIKAGGTLTVTATATNTGDAPLYRVNGVTESDNPLLGSLEFAFGKLNPGESRTWAVDIKIPNDINSRGDNVTLSLSDHHELTTGVKTTRGVTMVSQERPRLSYLVFVDDLEKGNGDGVLQVGEEVQLKVRVGNLGPGLAKDVFVSAKNLTGEAVFLEQGRDELGEVPVGKFKDATLAFSLRQPADDVALRLTLWDNDLGAAVSHKVDFPVLAKRKVTPDARVLKVIGDAPSALHAGADPSTPIIGYAKPGTPLKSSAVVGDFRRVEAEGTKVAYIAETAIEVQRSKKASKSTLTLGAGEAAPDLTLEVPTYITTNDTYSLRGMITDDHVPKDVFVFVNDQKVFYQALSGKDAAAGEFSMPIAFDLPLKSGSNAIAVVVRETDDLVARQVFGLFRAGPQAVAKGNGEPGPGHP